MDDNKDNNQKDDLEAQIEQASHQDYESNDNSLTGNNTSQEEKKEQENIATSSDPGLGIAKDQLKEEDIEIL